MHLTNLKNEGIDRRCELKPRKVLFATTAQTTIKVTPRPTRKTLQMDSDVGNVWWP